MPVTKKPVSRDLEPDRDELEERHDCEVTVTMPTYMANGVRLDDEGLVKEQVD